MKALCPHCFGSGCEKCNGGHTEVSFAQGKLYTRACKSPTCGFENGGCIVGPGSRWSTIDERPEPDDCIVCGAPTKWLLVGDMPAPPAKEDE